MNLYLLMLALCYFHRVLEDFPFADWDVELVCSSSWDASSSSKRRSKFPRASGFGILFHRTLSKQNRNIKPGNNLDTKNTYSGTPSGGRTTDKMLSISLYLSILSLTVVDVREGEAFTSTSQGFKLLSIMISYP